MNKIELIDKIIKIPANKETLVMHEDNPEMFLIKIPRTLLTDNLDNSQVFLLAQPEEGERGVIVKLLDMFFENEEYIEYLWTVDKEYTAQEGNLIIQIKIIRDIIPVEEIPPVSEEENSEGTLTELADGTVEEEPEENKPGQIPTENLEEVDPGIILPVGYNESGVWFSYQNKFKVVKVLNPLV